MKKILSGVLVCALSLVLLCVTALAVETATIEVAGLIGTWGLTGGEGQGVFVDTDQLGLDLGLVFNEDGTASIMSDGEESEAVIWKLEGNTISLFHPSGEGEPMIVTHKDGKLNIAQDAITLIFEKGIDAAVTEAATIEATTIEAAGLVGTWILTGGEGEGIFIDKAQLGLEMGLLFNEDGTASLLMDGKESQAVSWKLEGNTISLFQPSGEGEPMIVTHKDGKLVIAQDAITLIFEKADAE